MSSAARRILLPDKLGSRSLEEIRAAVRKVSAEHARMRQAKELQERRKAAALVKLVGDMGFHVDDLGIQVDGDRVILTGTARSQEEREKIVLLVGNTEGIGSVDDRLQTAHTH
jgi:hypothetical protein